MKDPYAILTEAGNGFYEEKRSRFPAAAYPVRTEEEALSLIAAEKKKTYDARHHCFAYVLGPNRETVRFSDDGEPSGTAGKPILEVLLGRGVHDALIIVTRYFGGTLLGTGGLVRAYTEAAQQAVAASRIMEIRPRRHVECRVSYTDLGKIQYIFREMNLEPETSYQEDITLSAEVPEEDAIPLSVKIRDATAGKAVIEVGEMYIG